MAGQLSILIYHRVLPERDPLQPGIPDAHSFESHMRALRRFFQILPLPEAVRRLREDRLPWRALAITFDDGYQDNVDVALPILSRLNIPATFFIATGYLDGGCMWNDRIIEALRNPHTEVVDLSAFGGRQHALPRLPVERGSAIEEVLLAVKHLSPETRATAVKHILETAGRPALPALMMGESDIRLLRDSNMEIGAHTITHPILARLPDEQALDEIEQSRRRLASIIREPVRMFAYPNGRPGDDYDNRHVAMVRDQGFEAALSTVWGCATGASDRFQLPRFTPWDRASHRFVARLAVMRFRSAIGQVA